MVKCSFCDQDIEKGTGKIFIKKDGKILHFCSGKCEKNMIKLKRKHAKWTTKKKKTSEKKK